MALAVIGFYPHPNPPLSLVPTAGFFMYIPKLEATMHRYRTHTCGELRKRHTDQTIYLSGWLHRKRDHGGILFLDLRDHYGIIQLVFSPENETATVAAKIPRESVIRVIGDVRERSPETINSAMETGEVEIAVRELEVLSLAEPLPFSVAEDPDVGESTRLSYRFLDLRRTGLHRRIQLRSEVIASIRRRMTKMGFAEFQTPILTSSSPEGARDYLVPSRLYPGHFYALPQAPQQFKQLLMVSGFDRYFQIAPCFRDEDARADRSPGEFYQLDLEMAFVEQEDVFAVVEELFSGLFREFTDWKVTAPPFPRLSHADAMLRFGTDKPDLRFALEIQDLSEIFAAALVQAVQGHRRNRRGRSRPVRSRNGSAAALVFRRPRSIRQRSGRQGIGVPHQRSAGHRLNRHGPRTERAQPHYRAVRRRSGVSHFLHRRAASRGSGPSRTVAPTSGRPARFAAGALL